MNLHDILPDPAKMPRPVFVSELFAVIQARLAGRPADDRGPIHLRFDSYTCAKTVLVTGTFRDPRDGQMYRLALMPAEEPRESEEM